MLVVEADGSQHAENRRDQARDADLQERRGRILRFWNNDIIGSANGVLNRSWKRSNNPPHPAAFGATLSKERVRKVLRAYHALSRIRHRFEFLLPARSLAPGRLMVQAVHAGLAGRSMRPQFGRRRGARASGQTRAKSVAALSPGARLIFADRTPNILAYPRDRDGWGQLTHLLTVEISAPKG
jgi:hypothetical protein